MVDRSYVHFLCPLEQSSRWRDYMGVIPWWTLRLRCPVNDLGVFKLSLRGEVSF